MKSWSLTIVPLVTLIASVCGTVLGGCAGSNASRAVFDANRTLSLSQIDGAASTLVSNIVSNGRFVRYKVAHDSRSGAQADIVMLLQELDADGGHDVRWKAEILEPLMLALEEHLSSNSIVFRQDLDPGLPNYVATIGEFDKQDSDDRYDQSTGSITTGAAHKAVLGLRLKALRHESQSDVEIELRAIVVDGSAKTTLVSTSSRSKNPGRTSR